MRNITSGNNSNEMLHPFPGAKKKTFLECLLNLLPSMQSVNSLSASGDVCHLLIFAKSLGPDQARQNVGPDLDQNFLTLYWYSWKIFLKKLILKKNP